MKRNGKEQERREQGKSGREKTRNNDTTREDTRQIKNDRNILNETDILGKTRNNKTQGNMF